MSDTVSVPGREVPVVANVDVLVIGGGPAGVAAAVCAARRGAETMLVERYGYLGGLATGAMVIMLNDMCFENEITVAGIVDELQDRLSRLGGLVRPPREDWFQHAPEVRRKWYWWGLLDGWGRQSSAPVVYRSILDVETGKVAFFDMVTEARVRLRLHSWCVSALMEGNRICGAVLFSKSGYQAVKARVVIDASGDGDVFASAGAAFTHGSYLVSVPHYMANVDSERVLRFTEEHPDEAEELNRQVRRLYGASWLEWFWLTTNPGTLWCNCPHFKDYDGLDVDHLTQLEVEGRKRIWQVLAFVREHYPGFENAYISRTADQIGVRQTRLLAGEYVLTSADIRERVRFPDTVGRGGGYYYPYRSLLPKEIDNLLVVGRHMSISPPAQKAAREWPPCMVTGQAAGTAAALALEKGALVRDVPMPELQDRLRYQGVIL
jgi:hypothetical protein